MKRSVRLGVLALSVLLSACGGGAAPSPSVNPPASGAATQPAPTGTGPTNTADATANPDATPTAVEITELEAIIFDRPTTPAGLRGIGVGRSGFVAVGHEDVNGRIWTSPNGRDWQPVEGTPAAAPQEAHRLVDVVRFGDELVSVGWRCAQQSECFETLVWSSPDGASWSARATIGFLALSLAAGGPGLVGAGAINCYGCPEQIAVWTSANGTEWSEAPDPSESEAATMTDVIVTDAGLLGVGAASIGTGVFAAAVWTSPDGVTWTRVPNASDVEGGTMEAVTEGGPGLVGVGSVGRPTPEPAAWTSADGGATWKLVEPGGEGSMNAVAAANGRLVAVGESGGQPAIWTSADGVSWTMTSVDDVPAGRLLDLVFVPTGVIAVGQTMGDAPEDEHPLVVLVPVG